MSSCDTFPFVTKVINRNIDNINCKKSCGPDGITPKLLKFSSQALAGPLTKLLNFVSLLHPGLLIGNLAMSALCLRKKKKPLRPITDPLVSFQQSLRS
jgi:hypothetical protein